MSDIKLESPLVGQSDAVQGAEAGPAAGVSLFERPFLGHLNLRGNSSLEAFRGACHQVLGVVLPLQANTFVEGPAVVVAWLGPDEWLVSCEPGAEPALAESLRGALGDGHWAVTDVTGGHTVITVEGEHAAELLAKGTPLDLHPRVFGAGCCAQTVLARSGALIRVLEPGRAFELVVRRSFADYLWQWLRDAGQEYQCAALPPRAALGLSGAPVDSARTGRQAGVA